MTKLQTQLYWREWGKVQRYLRAFCDYSAEEVAQARKDLQAKSLGGVEKSSKDLSNADFDKVLGEFRAVSSPADMRGQLRQIEQPRTRLIHAIRELGLPEPYLRELSCDAYRTADWTGLPERDLGHFRYTATRAARRLANRQRDAARKQACLTN